MRALCWVALVLASVAACGHYAAPERARDPKKAAPVSAAPAQTAAADEACEEQAP
jgi:hypothetical protein